jgi:uncharacterized protein (DUF2342 family)
MKEFPMITAEYAPFPSIGSTHPETSAELATLTGSITGGACGLLASLMGVMIPAQGPIVAMSPILITLTGVIFGAMVGGFIGLVAEAALASYDSDDDANRVDVSLLERVAVAVRGSGQS